MGVKVTDNQGGDFERKHYFAPTDNMYIAEFVGTEETTQFKFQSTEEEPAWRWFIKLYELGTFAPVMDVEGVCIANKGKELGKQTPHADTQGIASDRTKQSLNVRSNAYARVTAFTGNTPEVGDDSDDLFEAMVGKRCGVNFVGGWPKGFVRMPKAMLFPADAGSKPEE